MLRHIPPFVLGKFEQGQYSGSFNGYVLLFGTDDFPIISNVFIGEGKRGAEELSRFLSEVVAKPIDLIEEAGGFVCQFSGESFYAVFPEADSACLHQLVEAIDHFFANHAPFVTRFGEYPVSIKQTVALGEVHWQIFCNRHQNEFIFYGEPFNELVRLHLNRGPLILSERAKSSWEEKEGFCRQKLDMAYDPKSSDSFLHPSFRLLNPGNAISSGGYCFINLANLESNRWEATIASIHDKLKDNGGYFHKLYFSDIGLTALVLFGLPKATETTSERMCRFALELIEQVPQISVGMSWGKAFSGLVGRENRQRYVVLGTSVVLAEHLLFRTHSKEVITDTFLKQEMQFYYQFEPAGTQTMTGIRLPVKYYRLKPVAKQNHHQQEGSFWGRSSELTWIKDKLYEAGQNSKNCIILIRGEAGMGKSKLCMELLSSFPDSEYNRFTIISNPDRHYPRDGIRQIVRNYFHYNPQMPKDEGLAMFRGEWAELAGSDPEMQRIESIIASLMGYTWKNSVWSILPEKGKARQLQNAFISFMQKMAKLKPIILHIDDLQWLDGDSKKLLEALIGKGVSPIHVIACLDSKSECQPQEMMLQMNEHLTLDLESLDSEACLGLLRSILQSPTVTESTSNSFIDLAAGNALYLEQFALYLKENQSLDESGNIKNKDAVLPASGIREIITKRIKLLKGTMLECLQYAAVLGNEFNVSVLKGMFQGEDVLPELKEGKKSGFWQDLNEMDYVFLHREIHTAAYHSIDAENRKQLHLKAAVELEKVFGKEKESLHKYAQAIALHYKMADEIEKATQHYLIEGLFLQETYEVERAKIAFQEGIALNRKFFGPESVGTVFFMEKLGSLFSNIGELDQAEEIFQRTLEIKKKRLGVEHLETAVTLNHLGNVFASQGELTEAESCFSLSAEIRKKLLGDEHQNTIRSVINLADIYHRKGKYEQSVALYTMSLDPRALAGGAQNLLNAEILNHLGVLFCDQKNYEMAENYHTKALDFFQKLLGREHPKTVETITNLAKDYLYLKNHDQSEILLVEAISICERIYGVDNPVTANNIHNLGCVYLDTSNLPKTEVEFTRALEIRIKSLGLFDPVTLSSYNSIAMLYYKMGSLDKTENALQQSLIIARMILGNEHIDTAKIMFNLATVRIKLEKYTEAEPLYLEALVQYEKEYGLNHPDTKDTLKHVIRTYQYLKQPDKAAIYKNMLNIAENKRF
jgi:tetratricopeptide (TPR) repeat protein/class 3 adenylate cyclase